MLARLAEIRKAVAAAVGGALTVLGVRHRQFGWPATRIMDGGVGALVAVLTVAATWATPNKPSTPDA